MNKEVAIQIVNFLNSSNSKLSESYWILRTDLQKIEYDKFIIEYKNKFIKSAYSNTNRQIVQKKFTKKNLSRGYSGDVTINDKKYFCRSKNEFIYLHYLSSLYKLENNYKILTEKQIFYIEDESYKPDIFIYHNNVLVKIFEIKDKYYTLDDKYYKFSEYFKTLNISFEILNDSNYILKTNQYIKDLLKDWLNCNAHISVNVSGENNPRFGAICSEKTKNLIGEKAKERCKNKDYIKIMSECQKQKYKDCPELSENISKRQKIRYEKNHYRQCIYCNKEFYVKDLRKEKVRKMCYDDWCMNKFINDSTYIKGIINHSIKVINNDFDMNIEEFLKKFKEESKYTMSENVISKYFGDYEKLIKIIKKYENN